MAPTRDQIRPASGAGRRPRCQGLGRAGENCGCDATLVVGFDKGVDEGPSWADVPAEQRPAVHVARVAAASIDGHGANTPTSKDTNPKDAVAVAHVKFSALPWRVLAGIALALTEGAWKYGRHNYRIAGVRASVYFDAALDHLLAWYEGEDIDPASGFHHIDKAIAGLVVLRDAMLSDMVTDDRPPEVPAGWIEKAHADTRSLFERMQAAHGAPRPPCVRQSRAESDADEL